MGSTLMLNMVTQGLMLFMLLGAHMAFPSQEAESPVTCNNVGVTCADGLGNVDIINNVFSLEQCRVECVAREDCQFLTYLHDPAPGSFVCFLFSTCDTVNECDPDICVSEPCSTPTHPSWPTWPRL